MLGSLPLDIENTINSRVGLIIGAPNCSPNGSENASQVEILPMVKIDLFRGNIRVRLANGSYSSKYDSHGARLKGKIVVAHRVIRDFVRNGYQSTTLDVGYRIN